MRYRMLFVFLLMLTPTLKADTLIFLKQDSEPKFMPNGSGLCDQVYRLLANELAKSNINTRIDSNFYPLKRVLKKLEFGEGDVFCGAGDNPQRRKKYVFSALPVYLVSNVIMSHIEEKTDPGSLENIAQKELVIGALYGSNSSKWLMSQTGVKVSDNHHSLDKVSALIASQKALKYFYYHDLGMNYYVKKNALPLKLWPTKYLTVPQWLLINANVSSELIDAINQAMSALERSEELLKIQQQFLL